MTISKSETFRGNSSHKFAKYPSVYENNKQFPVNTFSLEYWRLYTYTTGKFLHTSNVSVVDKHFTSSGISSK